MRTRPLHFVLLLLLAAGTIAAYWPSLHSPFLFDDVHNIVENPVLRDTGGGWSSLAAALRPAKGLNARPLAFFTFALNYRFGEAPFGFHLANLAILLLSIPAAFWLARLLAGSWHPAGPSLALATAATILWVANPLLTNGVTYVVQRMTSLSVLLCLIALACFVRGWRGDGPHWHAGAALAWAAAVGTKESALVLPLPALLYARFVSPPGSARARWSGAALAGGIVATQAAMIVFAPQFVARKWIPPWSFTLTERFLTEGRVVAEYLSLFLWPSPSRLNLEHQVALSRSLLDPPATLLAFALHGALIAAAVLLRRARPLLALSVLSFYLLQLAEGTFLPVDLMFEHRVYFPGFFLALGLADLAWWGFQRLAPARAELALLAVAVPIGLFWGTLTHQRNRTWADPVELWRDTVAKSPGIARPRDNLGLALIDAGRYEEAVAALRGSLAIKEDNWIAQLNLGEALVELGRTEEAIAALRRVIALQPGMYKAYNNLAALYGRLGRYPEAEENARFALALRPNHPEALSNLGNVLYFSGRYEEAVALYQQALRLRPELGDTRRNLAMALRMLQARGRAPAPVPPR